VSLDPGHPFVATLLDAARRTYGERLVSFALFGSVARGTARPDSDLDCLLVVEGLPRGHRARLTSFEPIEQSLTEAIGSLAAEGVTVEISPVLRTPEELAVATPLMLDLTEDASILTDRGGVLARALDDLRRRLRRLGARRIWEGSSWYWDLKPDYRRGEIIRL